MTSQSLDAQLILLSQTSTTTPHEQKLLAAQISQFMQKHANALDGSAIAVALDNLTSVSDQFATRAVLDFIPAAAVASMSGQSLDQAMVNLSGNPFNYPNMAPASAETIQLFVSTVGSAVGGEAISAALVNLSYVGGAGYTGASGYTSVADIVTSLAPGQAQTLDINSLASTLLNLCGHMGEPTVAPAPGVDIEIFLGALGTLIGGQTLAQALQTLTQDRNDEDVIAILFNLSPAQITAMAGSFLDQAMVSLGGNPYIPQKIPPMNATTIANFMKIVGSEVSDAAIGTALENLSYAGDQKGVSAVVDNLAAGQAAGLAGNALDETIINLAGNPYSMPATAPANAATIADFMQKVGDYISGSALGYALQNLSQAADKAGVKAVVDNLAPGQATQIPATYIDNTLIDLSEIATPTMAAEKQLAGTLADYMQALGQYGDSSAWAQAVSTLENAGDQVAANAILNNEPSEAEMVMHTQLATMIQAMATYSGSAGAHSPTTPLSGAITTDAISLVPASLIHATHA